MQQLDQLEIPHSIFDKKRKTDFNKLFVNNVPVIFAWGVDKKLESLAKTAIKRINQNNPIGVLKPGSNWA